MTKTTPKPRRSILLWLLPLLGILAGSSIALALAPRYQYHPPKAADEARLKERAAEYYRAGRLFDYAAIARFLTPANQLENSESIQRMVEQFAGKFASFDPATQKELQSAADGIKPDLVTTLVDGDWAQTGGKFSYKVETSPVELPLEDVVWVRTAGDWWIYKLENPEILTYGLPPEPIRQALLRPDEKFELEDLPKTLKDVPKEGDERYKPENAMSEEEGKRIREEEKRKKQEAEQQQGGAGKQSGATGK